jgi:hypothetical protein
VIITCRQLVEKVTDKREGRLSVADRAGWAAHLAWCGDCALYIEQYEATVGAVKHLPRRASDDARAKVLGILGHE